MLNALLRTEAASAAGRIGSFLDGIKDQLSWTVRQAWSAGAREQHRFDALGVLRQVPAVVSITLVDGDGIEQLYVSRIDLNRIASGVDRSRDLAVSGARSARTWYGPVTYYHDSEPFMAVAVAGNRKAAGIAVAEINLKLIWDVISAIRVGHTGHAFVLDQSGRLIAHPDISLVLRGTNDEALIAMRRLRQEIDAASGEAITIKNTEDETVVTAMAAIPGADWMASPLAVSGARSARTWYGPVTYYHDSEPFMAVAVAGNRKAAGIAVAEINLKLIWDVISAIRVGHTGHAFVLDQSGRLIAHPDISLVLRGTNDEALIAMRRLRQEIDAASGEAITIKNTEGETVVTAMAAIPGADWMVFVEQPLSEAFAPIRSALWRTGGLLLAGTAFAGASQ